MSHPVHKHPIYTHISLIMLALLGCSGVIYGAINYSEYFPNSTTLFQSQANGWASNTGWVAKEIMTPEWCRKITSTASSKMFIATNTLTEWASFRDHLPSGVSVDVCNPYLVCTAAWQVYTASTTYPGCSEPDKLICHGNNAWYIWSMCNLGTNIAGTGAASYGSFFQWWRNVAFPSTGTVTPIGWPLSLAAANATSSYIGSSLSPFDWLTPQDNNRWWWATASTYSTASPWDQVLMQWPCASEYHVPTYNEANSTVVAVWLNIKTILKWWLSGGRSNSAATISAQGTSGYWWLSWVNWINSRVLTWNNATYSIANWLRASGFPVRCIKN